jgi:hypothetical protein
MQKIITFLILSLSLSEITSAQTAMAVYFEGGGPGIASFNFDTRFSGKRGGIGGRVRDRWIFR